MILGGTVVPDAPKANITAISVEAFSAELECEADPNGKVNGISSSI